jgi:dipeptidase E
MRCFNESGLTGEITNLLKERVYVGASAGSYIATPDLRFNSDGVDEVLRGLHLVPFGIQAHYLSPHFTLAKSFEAVQKRVEGCEYPVYALDDQTAIKVIGDEYEVIGGGKFKLFEPQ